MPDAGANGGAGGTKAELMLVLSAINCLRAVT